MAALFRKLPSAQLAAAAVTTLGGVTLCNEDCVPAAEHHWNHHGALAALDARAVRRGFQVYKEVCASCHSLELICFRNLVEYGAWSEAEMKTIAADYDVTDGPNGDGEMFDRPGKLTDPIPKPYANEEAGAAANNGAYPPDLSLMAKARHAGVDYIFALLTGYCDPPEGKEMMEGLYYNPYFSGSSIAMPPPLQDGQVEYPDGTPATVSQMAKDVAVFLAWASEPIQDDRKLWGAKWIFAISVGAVITGFYKRFRWAPLKTRKISYTN